jgi:hypothetical protein
MLMPYTANGFYYCEVYHHLRANGRIFLAEPLVMPSEISGLDDLRGFLKYRNQVARMAFPFISLREKSSRFDEHKMDDLIGPSSSPLSNPEEIQGNFLLPEPTEQRSEHQME